MARTATIVSFDEARRSSRTSRYPQKTPYKESPSSGRPLRYEDPGSQARFTSPFRTRSTSKDFSVSRAQIASGVQHASSAARTSAVRSDSFPRASSAANTSSMNGGFPSNRTSYRPSAKASSSVQARTLDQRVESPSWYSGPDEQALRKELYKRAEIEKEAHQLEDELNEKEKGSLVTRLRRKRAKRKADRLFGDERDKGVAPASSEAGPRAALYKGVMGSSQRRASRMQDEAAEKGEGKRSARRKKGLRLGPKLRVAALSLACLALVCIFLYQPAQQYYVSLREHDALEAEYEAIEARDAALQDKVDALSTDAGIETLAHEQFGLVNEGEVSVSVEGLEIDESDESSDIPPYVSSGSVSAPQTWYSVILDPLFGVSS